MTAISFEKLQQENTRLLTLIGQYERTIEQQKSSIQNLHHQLHLFRSARFGRKSEKSVVLEQYAFVFDEARSVETDISDVTEKPETETITYTRSKHKTGRKPLPKSLPYLEKIHDLADADKQCACGCALTPIGNEITEQLDVVPQMTFRVVHIRKKYACKGCENTIQLAQKPKQPIDKAIAAPGLLAAVTDAKFNRHMPLYRQEAMFAESKLSITRGTLSHWLIQSAHLLTPLVKLMEADIHTHDIAYADETPLQVLKEKGRSPTQKSYMWLFVGGPPDKRAFVYQYHPTRAHSVPFDFFTDFKGYLHADCYGAYVALGKLAHIQHVACWAHARRYFVEVAKSTKKEGLAHQVVKHIGKLYQLERELKDNNASFAQIFMRRVKDARPILIQIKKLLDEAQFKVPPKSPIGAALHYSRTHWNALNHYLHDGRLEIDNNRSERAIKPFVIGRKNWLFHGNDIGAHAGSILFSLIETCKQHQVDVFSWLKYVLANIHRADTV
ncbi:MAG: IS66 family transposase, partial [Legionellales bacterium]|nr:IS66 family transposase [Legionellales bacterium]